MPKKLSTTDSVKVAAPLTVAPEEFTGKKLSVSTLAKLVVDLQHNLHRSTAHTKTRGEVAGSTKKPWRQKGTGRARVGSKRTPLWRGGGQIFGPRSNRNFFHKVNQGLLIPALTTLLQDKAAAGEMFLLDQSDIKVTKTKAGLQLLQGVLDPQSNLLIVPTANPALSRALRNVPYITLRTVQQFNLLDVATHRHMILWPGVLPVLTQRLAS